MCWRNSINALVEELLFTWANCVSTRASVMMLPCMSCAYVSGSVLARSRAHSCCACGLHSHRGLMNLYVPPLR